MRARLLLALAVLLAAAAGAWWAARPPPPGDEALIRALLEAGARAAEARQPAEAVAGVSDAFRGNGLDKRELKRLVAAATLRGAWVAVKLAAVEVAVDGDAATARFGLVLTRGGAGGGVVDLLPEQGAAYRVEAALAREPDGWRVVRAAWRQVPLEEALAPEAGEAR